MKRILSIVLLLTLCLAMLPVNALADYTAKVYISSTGKGTLNLRKGPGKGYKVVGYVKHNAKVTVTSETSGEWTKIKSGKKTGWIKTMYFDGTTKELGTGYKSLKLSPSQTLIMRKGAGTKYKKKGVCSADDSVKVLYTEDGWADVTNMTTGKTGWIPISYIGPTVTISSASAIAPPASAADVFRTTASTLNMRKGPGTKYKKVAKLPRGTAFTVLDEDGNWYKIKVLRTGETGWVSKTYTTKYATATIATRTDPLNVRTGPGTNRSVIGSIRKGAKVTVKSQSGDWFYVNYGSLKGWCSRYANGREVLKFIG